MSFKIYTKTGDAGLTSLIGGTRLPKQHLRIEAYGTVDELNSHIGLLRDVITVKESVDLLVSIQDRLFTIGSHLAADPKIYLSENKSNKISLPPINEKDVEVLEQAIDLIDEQVPEMKSFILPGGHVYVSILTLLIPFELEAKAKALSAREYVIPPWAIPKPLSISFFIIRLSLQEPISCFIIFIPSH